MRLSNVSALTLVLLTLAGCGEESDSTAPAPPPVAIAGTSVAFDLDADLQQPEHYYDFPTTSDLRLTAAGTPDVSGFPNVRATVRSVKTIVALRRGFPVTPACSFHFDARLADRDALAPIAAERNAPILLVDVDAHSPERGRLFPTVATVPPPDDYVPDNVLAVAAMPGVVLHPHRIYAFQYGCFMETALHSGAGVVLAPLPLPSPCTPAP